MRRTLHSSQNRPGSEISSKAGRAEPRQGFLKDEQYDALQAKCKHAWLKALIAVAYNFGFRKSELLGLRVNQVDLNERSISLWTGETKSGKGRKVVMTDEVYRLLKPCVEGKKPNDPVFTWENGDSVLDFRSAWRKMCKASGVTILFHDFRRTAVRNMIRAGVSGDVAKKISGRATDSIFSRYNITGENDLSDAAVKIEIRKNGRKLITENSEANQ
jgi:integrase